MVINSQARTVITIAVLAFWWAPIAGWSPRAVANEEMEHAWFGVLFSNKKPGVYVEEAFLGDPAAGSGIRSGDRIISFNGAKIESREQFIQLIRSRAAGERVNIRIQRRDPNSAIVPAVVTLTSREAARTKRIHLSIGSAIDERLFLLYVLHGVYRAWPDTSTEPASLLSWLARNSDGLAALRERAGALDHGLGSAYDDALLLIRSYRDFIDANNLIENATAEQIAEATFWTGFDLGVVAAGAAKTGNIPAAIGAGLLALIQGARERNQLSEVKADLLTLQAQRLENEFDVRLQGFHRLAAQLAKRHRWDASDVDFSAEFRPLDPILKRERAMGRILLFRNRGADIDEYDDFAKWLLGAFVLVPTQREYDDLRAQLAIDAATICGDLCEEQVQGLYANAPAESSARATDVARVAWSLGKGLLGADTRARAACQLARALALAGQYAESCEYIERAEEVSHGHEFWYGKAKVCALANAPLKALHALRNAFRLGLADVNEVKSCDDLENLRSEAGSLFGDLCTPTATAHVNEVGMSANYTVTNTSEFPLTNVRVTLDVTRKSGDIERRLLTVQRVDFTAAHTWISAWTNWLKPWTRCETTIESDQGTVIVSVQKVTTSMG